MLYQLSYASTLKPGKNNRTAGDIASAFEARHGPPLWKLLRPASSPPPVTLPLRHLLYNSTMPTESAAGGSAKNAWKWAIPAVLAVLALVLLLWLRPSGSNRQALLSWMPADAESVLFLDLDELKRAPFFAQLRSWAPQPTTDAEYQQFVEDTGFNYETDLQRVAVSFLEEGGQRIFFAVADGRFDQRAIEMYATRNGAQHSSNRIDVVSVPAKGSRPQISFCFLSKNRLAFSNDPGFERIIAKTRTSFTDWQPHFERVAGSPMFLILNNDGLKTAFAADSVPQELARRSSGYSSPQPATLLAQLQWVTIAGKPENDGLRIVAEGETVDQSHAHQLADFLNGILLLARAGLTTTSSRQLEPGTRNSYISLLKTVEVTQLDRGDTKSVRLMLVATPDLLKSGAISIPPATPDPAPPAPKPNANTHR
jgi:hypothetical protein